MAGVFVVASSTNASIAWRAMPSWTAAMKVANIATGGIRYNGPRSAGGSWNQRVRCSGTKRSSTS